LWGSSLYFWIGLFALSISSHLLIGLWCF
jgi:hypothetical protein